jgi:hypothetical protein
MTQPRTLRPVPDPLGCYLRPGRNDHKVLLQMLVDGINIGTGLVADPVLRGRQADLMSEARRLGVETVLGPAHRRFVHARRRVSQRRHRSAVGGASPAHSAAADRASGSHAD